MQWRAPPSQSYRPRTHLFPLRQQLQLLLHQVSFVYIEAGYYWVLIKQANSDSLCCVLGFCAGGAVVSAGLSVQRVDKAGKPACEDCGTRLYRCKGRLYKQDPGKICHACYNLKYRPSSAAADDDDDDDAALLPAPKKRRVQSDPGELASSFQQQLTLHDRDSWEKQRWKFV
jgi:hypothetical protein